MRGLSAVVWQAMWLMASGSSCLFGVSQAAAQPAAAEASEPAAVPGYAAAVHEAVSHYSAGRWQDAQRAFERAHALQPSARTFRGLGLSAYYLHQYPVARRAFEQALADRRRALPVSQRNELETLLPVTLRETARVELQLSPSSAKVELDGVEVGERPLYMNPGAHALAVHAEGRVSKQLTLLVSGGEDRMLAVELEAAEPTAALVAEPPSTEPAVSPEAQPPVVSAAAKPPEHEPEPHGRVLTWIAAAAVPVFAGTAAAIWFTGQSKHDAIERECRRDACGKREAERRAADAHLGAHETWATVALTASGVALGAAALLFVLEAPDEHGGESRVTLGPGGVSLSSRF